jgi:hypothetical protein
MKNNLGQKIFGKAQPFTLLAPAIALFIFLADLALMPAAGRADSTQVPASADVYVEKVLDHPNGGYGYRLEYIVPASIDVFWRFKTDFKNAKIVEGAELIGHKHIKTVGNRVLTENRFASAPRLKFLWQTTVFPERYRLEFVLQNAKDCRHDFHYGSIQLSPAGNHTKVTQTAFFNFRGASFWVRYPWYGGMKSTLTKTAKLEQRLAAHHLKNYVVASLN